MLSRVHGNPLVVAGIVIAVSVARFFISNPNRNKLSLEQHHRPAAAYKSNQ